MGAQGSGIATALVLWLQAGVFAIYVSRSAHYRDLGLFAHFEGPDTRAIVATASYALFEATYFKEYSPKKRE